MNIKINNQDYHQSDKMIIKTYDHNTDLIGAEKVLFFQMFPEGLNVMATTKSLERYVPSPNNDV